MEFKNCVTCFLRALLTLTVLYGLNGQTAAKSTAAPEDMDIDTLVDDEDVQIKGVSFSLELRSTVERNWCIDKFVLTKKIRSRLLIDLNEECKCVETSVSIISQDDMECLTRSDMRYYGEIQQWTSSVYSVKQLARFLDSWRPLVVIEGSDVDFGIFPGFNFTFNVTNSQTTMVNEDVGSGGGVNIVDMTVELGSGGTDQEEDIKINNIWPEQDKRLISGTQGVHIVGSIVSLITGVVVVAQFCVLM